jgi:lysophospholipase L1-like esterase
MDKQIVVVTPLQRYAKSTFNPADTHGKYLRDFVNALKTICADYGVTCVDLYSNSKFHMNDAEFRKIYVPDGTHPNAIGTDRYVENGIFPALDGLWLYRDIDKDGD